jgi:maltose alpha-D-glucosyltransferase/alpha-amylase
MMGGELDFGAGARDEPMRNRAPRPVLDVSSDALLAFLSTRRWFGAKGREPRAARIVDAVPVGEAGWIARVDVSLKDGVERYQLTLRGQGSGVRDRGEELAEGLEDSEFGRALGEAVTRGTTLEGTTARWVVDRTPAMPDELPMPRLAGAEQSNTSLIFGDRAIMKLYRRLEPGEHPEAELARFLTTRAHFPNTPELLATARFESATGAEVAAMLQRFLSGSRDVWAVALERGRDAFATDAPTGIPFVVEAETLGSMTRAMHIALASDDRDPAFAPEAASAADVAEWANAARVASDRTIELLERARSGGTLSADIERDVDAVIQRRNVVHGLVEGWITEIGDDAGSRMRHHGDYHLGQVLQTADGELMVIDFEGEPARPLAERRAKHSALRDVASMMRSFAYAAATCAEVSRAALGNRNAMTRAQRWERELREAFLRGYLPDGREHPSFLPQARARLDVLLTLFETEKVLYELAYELNNRPTWVWIPLRGLLAMTRPPRSGSARKRS